MSFVSDIVSLGFFHEEAKRYIGPTNAGTHPSIVENQEPIFKMQIPAGCKSMLVRRSAVFFFFFLAMRIIFAENTGLQFSVSVPEEFECNIEKS